MLNTKKMLWEYNYTSGKMWQLFNIKSKKMCNFFERIFVYIIVACFYLLRVDENKWKSL